jgi:hypothetical protein
MMTLSARSPACNTSSTRDQYTASRSASASGGASAGVLFERCRLRYGRQRDLNGIGTNTLCRIIDRSIGPIADWPLHKSIIEMKGRMRIEWNTAPFGDD